MQILITYMREFCHLTSIFQYYNVLIASYLLISEYLKGIEKIWILGDDFGFKSFNKYCYEQEKMSYYSKETFKVSGFNNNKELSYDRNTLSRMRNGLQGAIKDKKILPKFIFFIPDDDLIEYFKVISAKKYKKSRVMIPSVRYRQMIRWLIGQYDKLIATQKSYLKDKCKRENEPKMVWIHPPLHDYFTKQKTKQDLLSVMSWQLR